MGTIMFIILHLIAIMFGAVWLMLTIPLHMIYGVLERRYRQQEGEKPTPRTHVRCPDCAELIMRQARICKHCGCKLKPS